MLFIAHVYRPLWDSIGPSGIISLLQCNDSIDSHLASIHLSRETIAEGQLILARAGLFDLDKSLVAQMSVCAKHRHTYGKFWQPRTACQYPAHQGRPGRSQKGAKSRYSVNLGMAKAIKSIVFLFKSVQVRTTNCNFLTHLLLHNTGVKTFHRFSLQNSLPQF